MKASKTDTYCGQLPVACKACLFLADCRAWQADFQRGMMAIQEFNAQRDGDSPDKFAKLMQFLSEEYQVLLIADDTGRASDLKSAFQGALKELHPQPWLHCLIDEL